MSNSLQEQMLKLGLVDEKQVRDAEQTRRSERRPKGQSKRSGARGGRERTRSENARALETARKAALEGRSSPEVAKPELQAEVGAIVKAGRWKGQTDGRRRFYFDSRGGRVPYLTLNDDVIGELEKGTAALVESPSDQVSIINADAAVKVMGLDVDWLRRWNA